MRIKIVLALFIVGLTVVMIGLWRFGRANKGLQPEQLAQFKASLPTLAGEGLQSSEPAQAGGKSTSAQPQPSMSETEFKAWIAEEAKQIDRPGVNSENKRQELAQVVSRFTPEQRRLLVTTALSDSSSAGEKILATYMAVEAGPAEMRALIEAPMPDRGPRQAHSEAEMRSVQDRAIRIMALDGLAARAKTDTNAREELAKSIPAIQDPYIRDYAKKVLAELSAR